MNDEPVSGRNPRKLTPAEKGRRTRRRRKAGRAACWQRFPTLAKEAT